MRPPSGGGPVRPRNKRACTRFPSDGHSLTFADLAIEQDMVDALAAKGIVEPFPIQTQTIPLALTGQDIIGQAKTGTGKTFGFGLPLIQALGLAPGAGRAGARRRPDPRALRAGDRGPRARRIQPRDQDRLDLRRQGVRGPDRAARRPARRSWSARPAACSTSPASDS